MTNENQIAATVSVDIEADLERVWRALTTSAGLEAWMGHGSFLGRATGDELVMSDPVTGQPKRGVLEQVNFHERLVYTWWSEESADQTSEVTITVEPIETGTRVTVVERDLASVSGPVASSTATERRGASWAWRTALLALAAQTILVAATSRP